MGRLVDQLSLSLAIARISIGFQAENQGLQGPHKEQLRIAIGADYCYDFQVDYAAKKGRIN